MKKRVLLVWILGFLLLLPAAKAGPIIAEVHIRGNIVTTNEKRILEFLPFKKGEPFDPDKFEEGILNLKRWGIFEKVEPKIEETPQGKVLSIDLHEGKIIGEINIRGNYPYVENKIRKRINLQVGALLVPAEVEEQAKRIKQFYLRKGYFNTVVKTEITEASANNAVQLTLHIFKGQRLRYSDVTFEGVRAIPASRLYSFITVMDIHSKRRLMASLQKITQMYRQQGYLKAKIKVLEKKIDWKKLRVSLKLGVHEGPQVRISFKGKRPYRTSTLKKIITLYEEGNFDTIELQASANALIQRLKKDGYPEGRVTFRKNKVGADGYAIEFWIMPGVRSYVQSIDFHGNFGIEDKNLRNQLFTKKHSLTQKGALEEELMREDLKVLTEFYQSQGYPEAVIFSPKIDLSPGRTRYFIHYNIEEGPSVTVDQVLFEGTPVTPNEKFFQTLKNKSGAPFNKFYLPMDLDLVKLFYANQGYPYAKVQQELARKENRVTVTYHVQEGSLVHIGDILYIGDVLTGVRAMRQAIRIKTGEPYNYQKIIEAQLGLRRLGAFDAVSIEPLGLEEKKTTIPLKIKVEERRPFVLDMEGQYSTDTQYAGTLKFTNYNSFGWAKQTRLLFTGGIEKDRAEISWLDPLFLGTDVQMGLASWIDYEKKPIENSLQTGGSVSFFRVFRRFGFLSRYQLTQNYIFEGQATDPRALRDSTLSEVTLSSSYDTRNSYAMPTRGLFAIAGAQIFNEIGGLEANFAKWKLGLTHYLPLLSRLTFSNTFRFNRIENIGSSTTVPQREALTLGGDDTVRGFQEDRIGPLDANGRPLGGRLRFIFNSEFQIQLAKFFQMALFYDAGSLTDSFGAIDRNAFRNSAGVGLRYITPVGPIRADYGIILDRQSGEDFGRFHLTFGYML